MKVYKLLLTVVLILSTKVFSQIEFTTHIITPNAGATTDNATYVLAFDVENDGDMDILSASWLDDKIAWYENDGNENFVQHIIYDNAPGASWLASVDFDGDGDTDVLSTAMVEDRIYWYENDGIGHFTAHIIFAHPNPNRNDNQWHGFSVSAYDVDSDGDMDALYGGWANPEIKWHENDGSDTTFTTHIIDTLGQRCHVIANDMDGDGDADILAVSQISNTVAWYENDGEENFTRWNISNTANHARTIISNDIDEDGDIDIVAALFDDKAYWYENDGNQNFTAHRISNSPYGSGSIYVVDVNNDDDLDILTATGDANMVGWLENDGNEHFTFHVITRGANYADTVWGSDVDGDGDVDVLSAALYGDQIAWYENRLITTDVETRASVILEEYALHQNYPNPFNPRTTISYSIPQSGFVELKIYNMLGREIQTVVNELQQAGSYIIDYDASSLSNGLYFYQLKVGNRFCETKKMLYIK